MKRNVDDTFYIFSDGLSFRNESHSEGEKEKEEDEGADASGDVAV